MNIIYEKSLWDYREECRDDIKKCIEKLEQLGKLDELETQLNYEYSDCLLYTSDAADD